MKPKNGWRLTAIIAIIALILFGNCASTSRSRIPDLAQLTPQAVQLKVQENFQKLKTFEGRARVIIELPGSGNSGFSEVFVALPDSIFVKTEAILGIDIGALFLDHERFGAYAPKDNILYYGEIELLDLRDFLEIELSTQELYEALTGLNQVRVDPASTLVQDGDELRITTLTPEGEWRYWIDPEKFVVSKSQLVNQAGETVMIKEFNRLRKNKGIYLPQIIRLTRPQARERITVYYTRQKVNNHLQPEHFRLKVARNARRVYWGDIDNPRLDRQRLKGKK